MTMASITEHINSTAETMLQLIVDGTAEDGTFQGDGESAPFAVFSPELQRNVAGPFATRAQAQATADALTALMQWHTLPATAVAQLHDYIADPR